MQITIFPAKSTNLLKGAKTPKKPWINLSHINPKETVGGRNQDAACSAALPVQ